MDLKKVLIIKTGYTEILDGIRDSRIASLGDVLRTTALLHRYKESHISWATSEESIPLLDKNPHIHKLLDLDWITALQLQKEEFDYVINLEKVPGICALADVIRARRSRYGFTLNSQTGEAEALDKGHEVLSVSFNPAYKKDNKKTFQELLFEMVGETFNGEECILGYQPKTEERYDVGFNTLVGSKWPTKQWAFENWDKLEKLVGDELLITRQDEIRDGERVNKFKNLYSYMDWINSSKLLVTNDSLGLHLALAMKKKVIGLFGPTSESEMYFYGRGEALTPAENLECRSCFKSKCDKYPNSCVDLINPERVAERIANYLK